MNWKMYWKYILPYSSLSIWFIRFNVFLKLDGMKVSEICMSNAMIWSICCDLQMPNAHKFKARKYLFSPVLSYDDAKPFQPSFSSKSLIIFSQNSNNYTKIIWVMKLPLQLIQSLSWNYQFSKRYVMYVFCNMHFSTFLDTHVKWMLLPSWIGFRHGWF